MRARATPSVALLLALALLGSCSSKNGDDTPGPTLPTAPLATTTTTASDPFAIPKVIDEAYVNRVLAALDQIDGDAVREILTRGTISFESIERLRAIYNDPEFDQQSTGLRHLLDDGAAARFRSPPGNRKTTVRRLVNISEKCVVLEVRVDFAEVVFSAPPQSADEFQSVVLESTQTGADPKNLNPTPWSISHDEVIQGDKKPEVKRCDAQ